VELKQARFLLLVLYMNPVLVPRLTNIYIDWLIDNYLTSSEQCFSYIQDEWVSDCCLMPNEQFSAISWREQVTFWWDDNDDVRFVLDQHAELEMYSDSSLKQ
jgi:uncharacterized protein YcaQ